MDADRLIERIADAINAMPDEDIDNIRAMLRMRADERMANLFDAEDDRRGEFCMGVDNVLDVTQHYLYLILADTLTIARWADECTNRPDMDTE